MAAYVTSSENKEPTSLSRRARNDAGRFALKISGNRCCLSASPSSEHFNFIDTGPAAHRSSLIELRSSILARAPKIKSNIPIFYSPGIQLDRIHLHERAASPQCGKGSALFD